MAWARHRSPKDTAEASRVDHPVSRTERRRAKKRHRRRQLFGAACVLVVVCAAGEAIRVGTANPVRRSALQTYRHGGRKATSTTSSTIVAATQHDAPESGDLFDSPAVAAYLSSTSEDVTAAVYDSIMKVDILATLLAQDQADGQALSPVQGPLAVDMIEQSDDDDAQTLWDSEGGATAVAAFDTKAGLAHTDPDAAGYWGLSTTTAADQVQLARTLAYPNTVLTPASQAYELGLMEHVDAEQTWGISAGVTAGSTVALKNGWLPLDAGGWQVNSIGYVAGAGRNYVIAVLTDDDTEANGIDFIQGLSGLIWQALAPSTS
jgi:hypothetical protein